MFGSFLESKQIYCVEIDVQKGIKMILKLCLANGSIVASPFCVIVNVVGDNSNEILLPLEDVPESHGGR
jgi:hypothetical protein